MVGHAIDFIATTDQIQKGDVRLHLENISCESDRGAKGVGEICSIPTTPAITNAIYHAVGVRIDQTPVDQEVIAKTLHHLHGG